jgi:ectonucleotide pyrophosphatase/phosphodiesterase family protein 4
VASTESHWWDQGEPLWVTAARDHRETRVYFWPGSSSRIRDKRPTEWYAYAKEEESDYSKRLSTVSRWLVDAARSASLANGSAATNHPFFAAYFEEPDASGHAHGPFGEATKEAIRRVDDALGEIRKTAGAAVWDATNVVLVSDHGMAELSPDRAVFLSDPPCSVPFEFLHIEGSDVVMHVWPRSGVSRVGVDANTGLPVYSGASEGYPVASAEWFDPEALARRVDACHPNVSAWTRDDVPSKFAYGANPRVGPVVVAANVGWTLCGGANGRPRSGGSDDWGASHSTCAASLGEAEGHRGAHGFDNDAIAMRAVFIARGPSFRKDGARLVTGLFDRETETRGIVALAGTEADANRGNEGSDAIAAAWETRTLAFENTAVFAIVAKALGISLHPNASLRDGGEPPSIDGVLSDALSRALFEGFSTGNAEDDEGNDFFSNVSFFFLGAFVSFFACHLFDRLAGTRRWPFEKYRSVPLEDPGDAQELGDEA